MRSKNTWRVKVVASTMPKPLILVADGGTARLFGVTSSAGKKSLKEKATLERESAHSPGRALVTDRTGRVFDSGGRTGSGPPTRSRHGAESDFDPHEVEVLRFAKRISRRIDLERRAGKIGALIVIAEPRFLGVLRQVWSGPTKKIVTREAAKDLVRASDAQILKLAMP